MSLSISTYVFFFNDTATTEIYTLSLHDALPIWTCTGCRSSARRSSTWACARTTRSTRSSCASSASSVRSEEHTSELQSRQYLVCRLLLEKKKKKQKETKETHTQEQKPRQPHADT